MKLKLTTDEVEEIRSWWGRVARPSEIQVIQLCDEHEAMGEMLEEVQDLLLQRSCHCVAGWGKKCFVCRIEELLG